MKILITGATGLIGSRLLERLVADGHDVLGLARYGSKRTQPPPLCGFGDVTEPQSLAFIQDFKPDIVCHLAAVASNTYANAHPLETMRINALGTANVVEACKLLEDPPTFLLASSSEVYAPSKEPLREDSERRAINPYAASKIAAEEYVRSSGLPFVILRPFNTYGRALVGSPVAVIDKAIVSALTKGTIELWDPNPQRDFLFREDHVSAYLSIIRAEEEREGVASNAFNFGTGETTTIGETLDLIARLTGATLKKVEGRGGGDHGVLRADNSIAHAILGWVPQWTLETGLKAAVQEWRSVLKEAVRV